MHSIWVKGFLYTEVVSAGNGALSQWTSWCVFLWKTFLMLLAAVLSLSLKHNTCPKIPSSSDGHTMKRVWCSGNTSSNPSFISSLRWQIQCYYQGQLNTNMLLANTIFELLPSRHISANHILFDLNNWTTCVKPLTNHIATSASLLVRLMENSFWKTDHHTVSTQWGKKVNVFVL